MARTKTLSVLTCLLLSLSIISPSGAQILNIDKSDTANYSSKARINFTLTTGVEIDKQKTTLYDATNAADLLIQKNRELYIASASYRFTYNGPDDFLNAGYIHLRVRHNYKNKFAPEAFTQYQWDNKRGLLSRALAGINYRYNFWKANKIDFNAGAGFMYEAEKWNYEAVDSPKIPSPAPPVVSKNIKFNSYIRLDWKANANSDVAVTVFIQTKPDRFQPRIAPLVQWNIQAGKHVGFTIGISALYDVAPVVPISHFYYNFSQSLLLKW